jgi:hypothetical protein
MGKKSPTIEFSVDARQKAEILLFCSIRGFAKPADLARFATAQYMRRYPLKSEEIAAYMARGEGNTQGGETDARAVQPERAEG